jgi:hypothetical protein
VRRGYLCSSAEIDLGSPCVPRTLQNSSARRELAAEASFDWWKPHRHKGIAMTPPNAPKNASTDPQVTDSAQLQYDKVLRAMRRDPLQAVAIAAGIGFVSALILRR